MPARRNRRPVPQDRSAAWRSDTVGPGSIVWGNVFHPTLNGSNEKWRPVVVVYPANYQHATLVAGLTTLDHYEDDTPRTPLVHWHAAGLTKPNFWWGPKLVPLEAYDMRGYIGELTLADAETLDAMRGDWFLAKVERRKQQAVCPGQSVVSGTPKKSAS
jgi:hypothetical protein